MRSLYVDIDPYQPLRLPCHIRMLSKSGEVHSTVSLKTAHGDGMNGLIGESQSPPQSRTHDAPGPFLALVCLR
jgi:hypothetical protein